MLENLQVSVQQQHQQQPRQAQLQQNCKLPIDDEDVVEGSGDCTTTGDDDSVGNNTDDLTDDPVEGSGDRNEDSVPSSNSVTDKPIVHSPSVPEESLDSIVNRATESSSTTSSTTMSSSSPSFSLTPSTPFPESEITSIDDGNDDYPFISPKFTPPRIPSAAPSFFARPGILAAVIGGTVVGLLCAILMVMFIVYRMRKKDEGSYPIDKAMKYRVGSNKHYA
ncbi:Syndecan-like protein [Sarcoptes scabiei]|uniref:Syndecan n=1 Tax=Sarcoptes scabiei TaxID=52283 RepID=A0A132A6J4_SARSC|nr:Syndecan-like protein [Sarcoptes scabiei]